jgi:membrane-associated phospholipid phosphatase
MTSPAQFRPSPAPKLDSALYAFDFNLTKDLGSATSTTRTADQTAIALFWADGAGTLTPPGHWNVIARELVIARGTSLAENARLFALLNMALADAAICAWECKYVDDFWRPVTAIRAADTDSNAATEADPAWTPLITTPPFPEYVSGHSTFSGAAATVLADFYGSDSIPFTTTSDDLPGATRSFGSFWEAAAEAGLSRVFGGIHFMSANQQGLQSGARLGHYVVEHFLGERRERGYRGRR